MSQMNVHFFHINIFVIGQWKHGENFRRTYSCDKDIHILPNIDILKVIKMILLFLMFLGVDTLK